MMELKVWVDGIPRVVCGATTDTTCHDVVIALAHALNRTGRFSLVEKWRDSSRPLTPAQFPLRELHKWGEYATEVYFILQQANSEDCHLSALDQLIKKQGDRPVLSHNFTPCLNEKHGDASVKRSLTFTGAHSYVPDGSRTASAKFRKTQKGPVPNGSVSKVSESSSVQPALRPLPRQHKGGQDTNVTWTKQHHPHPVPPPRRRSSPAPQLAKDSDSTHTTSSVPSGLHHSVNTNTNRVSPFQPPYPPRSQQKPPALPPDRHKEDTPSSSTPPPSHTHPGSRPQSQQGEPLRPPSDKNTHSRTPSPTPPPLPSSPPPTQPMTLNQFEPELYQDKEKDLAAVEVTLTSADHSRQASLEIEEYDLEHNFPDNHRDYSRSDRPSVSLEYRLEDGLGSGSGSGSGSGGHLEGEHARLVRLVNMQQERVKTQESQISLINTEITALEEKEKEYEEKLHVIMEELLLHENHQRDLEQQLNELDNVEWDNVLDGEKKCEVDLTLKIASCKASILDHEQKLDDLNTKEKQLVNEVKDEEEKLQQEKARIEEEEKKAKEEEEKAKEEISNLQAQLTEVQEKTVEYEKLLSKIDEELKAVEKELGEKQTALTDTEAKLKDENLKDFAAPAAVTKEDSKSVKSGETILKILEGRMSPRPPANVASKTGDPPSTPPFIAALAAAKQSGVWV